MDQLTVPPTGATDLSTVLAATDREVVLLDPGPRFLQRAVGAYRDIYGSEDGPTMTVLAERGVVQSTLDTYASRSRAAQLASDELLSLRTLSPVDPAGHPALVTDDAVFGYVDGGALVGAEAPDLAAAVRSELDRQWSDATPWRFRTPGVEDVAAALEREFGADVAADYRRLAVLQGVDSLPHREFSLLVLLGARWELSAYRLGTLAEDTGFASKASTSRAKTGLEDAGVVTTSAIPIDTGRPRQRLHLTDTFSDHSPEGLLEAVLEAVE